MASSKSTSDYTEDDESDSETSNDEELGKAVNFKYSNLS